MNFLTKLGLTLLLATNISVSYAQPYPILFVTQVPIPSDFTTIGAVFGNHKASMKKAGRGGDLWIKYPDGKYLNLTTAAGYGTSGMQGANSIAVRDPSIHWDGNKALFSMIVGAPTEQYQVQDYYWQIYEITGLTQGQTPRITRVAKQPVNYNNISPIYGTDDRIIFTSDRPIDGQAHLYPQLDEYEMEPTNTGLWSMDPVTGDLILLNHAPSGNFTPIIDSFGRVIFTQWDHLQQDQMADSDRKRAASGQPLTYGTFNFSSEAANAIPRFNDRTEVFPEPRDTSITIPAGSNLEGHRINHFFPWQINEDGTEVETLNHIGRHELKDYLARTFNDDSNIKEYYGQIPRFNPNSIDQMLHVKEDPTRPGRYYGTDAPEFRSHSGGQIIRLDAPPALNPDQMRVTYITHRDTSDITTSPSQNHSGLYRDPLPLSNGTVIASHTSETREDQNIGSREFPRSMYDFRLKTLTLSSNGYYVAGAPVTPGISKTIKYWDPDRLVTYSGLLWEWQAVEVRPRPRPATRTASLPAIEQQIFDQANVDVTEFKDYLKKKNLSLIISRDVTRRDDLDKQQPYNLRVAGTNKQTLGASGKIYNIANLQIFQADRLRAMRDGGGDIDEGRRVIGQPMHTDNAVNLNPKLSDVDLKGSVEIATDGSVAAFVPTRRAISWQLTDPGKTPVVRERNWLTFQPGEIRVCTSCHGINDKDQKGGTAPINPPQALVNLLDHWKATLSVSHDFNDDNTADIVWKHDGNGMLWMYQIADGKLQKSVKITRVADLNWQIVASGDFNKDGNADLLWRNKVTGLNWIYFMNGQTVISSVKLNKVADLNWKVATVADFNGDGKSDILWRHEQSGLNWIYFMNGQQITQSQALNQVADSDWQVAGAGDFNQDGYADIVWRHANSGLNWLYLMQGQNIISSNYINTVPAPDWVIQGVSDFNADGNADLLWRNMTTGENWIYLMNGKNIIKRSALGPVTNFSWEIAAVRDFNGDRMADILWRNSSTGTNYLHIIKDAKLVNSYELNKIADTKWHVINP